MFEYNLTSEMEFEQIRASNDQLQKENEELKQNLETLLEYNNKLLAVIEEINNNEAQYRGEDMKEYEAELTDLRTKVEQYENYVRELENDLERLRQAPQARGQGYKNESEVIKYVQDAFRNTGDLQKKFQQRILKITRDVEDLKVSTKSMGEDVMASLEDKQVKIQQLFDHFQKKDEIVELMSEKVNILQEYYLSKKDRIEKAVQTDNMPKSRVSIDSKQPAEQSARLEQKNRIIKIYEELVGKLRKKVAQKTF